MTNREALKKWELVVANIRKLKPILQETPADKEERITRLKKDWIAFSKYYFPEYASADFAPFHKKIAKAIINADKTDNNAVYAACMLAREHGKTALMMFLLFYMAETGRIHNFLQVSSSFDAAVDLIMPLILNLENNARIINDFGAQKSLGNWETGRWVTRQGFSIKCIGAGQSPRGTRSGEKRPDIVVFDDMDTDAECRNPERIKKKFNWIEQAVIPAMSLSETKRIIFLGNKIADVSCMTMAWEMADFKIQVNILDKNGKPSWSRYTLAQVQYMLSIISYASGQKEYFNNPIKEGTVFKDIIWGKVPRLNTFKYLVAYGDPSQKDSRKNDFKSVVLVGYLNNIYYIIRSFLLQTSKAEMIEAYYDHEEFVGGATAIYNYVEVGGLQSVYYEDLFLPAMIDVEATKGRSISIAPDNRKKPDKFVRIEANLEPLNRQKRMIFNEAFKNDPHMQRMKDQFKAIEPKMTAHDDGPDSVEGAVWLIKQKLTVYKPTVVPHQRTSKRY